MTLDRVVTYQCIGCPATATSSNCDGWAFGTKGRFCPSCFSKTCSACGRKVREHDAGEAQACLCVLVGSSDRRSHAVQNGSSHAESEGDLP